MALANVTDASFEQDVLQSDKPVLVHFWAEWATSCKRLMPELEAMAAEKGDELEVVQLNIDQNPTTTAKYKVTSVPTLNVYQGGEVVQTIVGQETGP